MRVLACDMGLAAVDVARGVEPVLVEGGSFRDGFVGTRRRVALGS